MILEDWIRSKYVRKEFLKRPGASNDRVDPGTHPALLPLFPTLHISPSLLRSTASCSVTCGRAVKSKADELCGVARRGGVREDGLDGQERRGQDRRPISVTPHAPIPGRYPPRVTVVTVGVPRRRLVSKEGKWQARYFTLKDFKLSYFKECANPTTKNFS